MNLGLFCWIIPTPAKGRWWWWYQSENNHWTNIKNINFYFIQPHTVTHTNKCVCVCAHVRVYTFCQFKNTNINAIAAVQILPVICLSSGLDCMKKMEHGNVAASVICHQPYDYNQYLSAVNKLTLNLYNNYIFY